MKNGFAAVLFLTLLPVLILTALLTYFSFDVVKSYSQFQNECRKHALSAQQILGKNLKSLLELNPQAKKLRSLESFYRKRLATATTPQEKAMWTGLLAKNITLQTILRTKQEGIVAQAQIKAQSILEQYAQIPTQAQIPRAKLQISRSPPEAIAPDFKPDMNFEKIQTFEIKWRAKAFNNAFLKILPNLKQDLIGSCSATLKKGEFAWSPQINEDKFSSKQVSSSWLSL